MKKSIKVAVVTLLLFSFFQSISCKKKNEVDCKTCKAYGIDGNVVATRQTCSADEEAAFRAENVGREISCQ